MATPEELFERHHVAIYRYFLRMTGLHETSEELTQEVFIRVLKGFDRYRESGQERAWLFQIARNLHCDHARQQRRQVPPTPFEGVELIEPQRQELRLMLTYALITLDDDEREAFVLVEICGFFIRRNQSDL